MSFKVPTIQQVIPGAYVNIVLKQDQPTGRTVQGVVQNVLTRGNHPRGIKVRLSDGRVGRVQTMATAGGGGGSAAGSATASAPYVSAASVFSAAADEAPREQIGLDAYIKPAKKQQKRRGGNQAGTVDAPGATTSPITPTTTAATIAATTTCPVCGDFEGDEAAVSHHVATHFD
ncbi:hypothetical protein Sste5346_008467 [Sporothrix stenoceras]|uniref:Uncharacterized protein n=1 Tax=Sporothrix stenoceras TaxID=5173 RepID=A0ABR3YQ79_9PEZI